MDFESSYSYDQNQICDELQNELVEMINWQADDDE